jgi:hypothetical protein
MNTRNEAVWRRALAFWMVWLVASVAFVLSVFFFSLARIGIETQLFVFLPAGVILLVAFLVGRWKLQPPEDGDGAEKWRIGSWIITFMLLEIALCGLVICGHLWTIFTHTRQIPGAF